MFPGIRIEGGLLGPDILDQIFAGELPGQKPGDFGLDGRRTLIDEIASVFADARAQWEVFKRRLERLPESDPGTSVTRDTWVIPFLSLLGYELRYNHRAYEVDGATFAISHRAGENEDAPPVHIVSARQELGRVAPTGRPRLAPHSLVQEFLNRTEHLWGIVTNGLTIRLLRDSTYIRRQAYVEFDLRQILEEQLFNDFAVLYRLLHRTRLPRSVEDVNECWLEKYQDHAIEQGGRVREHLRDGVEECIKRLANGFLTHPANGELREMVSPGSSGSGVNKLTAHDLYRGLLRLVYRFLFLLVSEERGLISANPIYREHYGVTRLRRLLDRRSAYTDHDDLWCSLRVLWKVLSDEKLAGLLGAAPLNGELFEPITLDSFTITNRDLLDAFWHLAYYQPPSQPPRRVNYSALDVEELGSVYESLLDYYPVIKVNGAWGVGREWRFELVYGSERKSTGSYYTPPELVSELVRSALEPVIEERLAGAKRTAGELERVADSEWRVVERMIHKVGGGSADSIVSRVGSLVKSYESGQTGILSRKGSEQAAGQSPEEPQEKITQSAEDIAQLWHTLPPATRRLLLAQACAEQALLSIRVLDPACGSGHFLLAAARRLGKELARIRTGEDEPAPERVREAIRDVVSHCIYGVDKNPLAVELCRVALWLEAHCKGKPLTFLDHHIRCGDSLVGVFDLDVLKQGIPDEAFEPVSGDDRKMARQLKKLNRDDRRKLDDSNAQKSMVLLFMNKLRELITAFQSIAEISDNSLDQVRHKKELYARHQHDPQRERLVQACNLWTAAFFQDMASSELPVASSKNKQPFAPKIAITTQVVIDHLAGRVHPQAVAQAGVLASRHAFFHWPLEFPEVFANGGFDVVLGNPPWERIKLQEQEFFAVRDQEIARAPTAAARKRLIRSLNQTNPELWEEYRHALHAAESTSRFLRGGGFYPLTGRGDINTYSVFAERMRSLLREGGRAGLIVPTGIATDDTNKFFFGDIVARGELVSLYDFENRRGIFPAVHRSYKFCLLTLRRKKIEQDTEGGGSPDTAEFAFFCHEVSDLADRNRRFTLRPDDFRLLNPNTRTAPVFRSRSDAVLTKAIYRRVPVLIEESRGKAGNAWDAEFWTMFHMANDSHLFRTGEELEADGFRLEGNVFIRDNERFLPLYEAKMIHQFNHRFGDYRDQLEDSRSTLLPEVPAERLADSDYHVLPRYWVSAKEVEARLRAKDWNRGWFLGWRNITNATNERTVIAAVIPGIGVGHSFLLMLAETAESALQLTGVFNSFVFDFCARQKLGGVNLTYTVIKQLPILPPSVLDRPLPFPWEPNNSPLAPRHTPPTISDFIRPRVLELTYTARDLKPFADDLGYNGPPFRYDPERRFLLRCELDALFFHLYLPSEPDGSWRRATGDWAVVNESPDEFAELKQLFPTPRDAVSYILDQFPIVRRKDEERFGEYRTRRVILEIYDAMRDAMRTGRPIRMTTEE